MSMSVNAISAKKVQEGEIDMKRSYQKPELEVEMFQLDADMAAGCKNQIPVNMYNNTCANDPTGLLFTDKGGCERIDVCYQSFTDVYLDS